LLGPFPPVGGGVFVLAEVGHGLDLRSVATAAGTASRDDLAAVLLFMLVRPQRIELVRGPRSFV
jgi:hypothetical protein